MIFAAEFAHPGYLSEQFSKGRQVFVPLKNDAANRGTLKHALEQAPDFRGRRFRMTVDQQP